MDLSLWKRQTLALHPEKWLCGNETDKWWAYQLSFTWATISVSAQDLFKSVRQAWIECSPQKVIISLLVSCSGHAKTPVCLSTGIIRCASVRDWEVVRGRLRRQAANYTQTISAFILGLNVCLRESKSQRGDYPAWETHQEVRHVWLMLHCYWRFSRITRFGLLTPLTLNATLQTEQKPRSARQGFHSSQSGGRYFMD